MAEEKKKAEEKANDTKLEQKEETSDQTKQLPEEIVDEASEVKDEKEPVLEKATEDEEAVKETKEESSESKTTEIREDIVEVAEIKDKKPEPKKKVVEGKPDKKAKKKDEKDEDFQYIVRISNTDIDGEKNIIMGLSQIKGIGRHMAALIADASGIDKKMKIGKLSEGQIGKIRDLLDNISSIAPGWMLNHRKDIDTGKDIHLISSDIDLRLRDDVNLLKMIRSYRGIRHESSLPVRGQRTRANNRRGLALGVSKKRV